MNRVCAVLLMCLPLSTPVIGGVAGSSGTTDRIVDVTVFPDRAQVVREARVDLPRGDSSIQFANLPPGIDTDSVRVTAHGVAATLGMVAIQESTRPPAESSDLLAARKRVADLESAMAALAAEDETDAELRAFLAALNATTTNRESKRLGDGEANPAGLQTTYLFLQSGLQDLAKGKITRAEKRRDLERELAVARARLEVLRPEGPIRVRTATVQVTTASPGALTVRLSYLVPGASWHPDYRASLDMGGHVSLETQAMVRQHTGEDWSGVVLRLSTAAPARGVRPPVLAPWLLRPAQIYPAAPLAQFAPGLSSERVDEPKSIAMDATSATGLVQSMMKEEEAARQNVTLLQTSYNLVFEVPGQTAIPGDDAEHLVALRQDQLTGMIEYHVIPMLSESAFLVVITKAPASHPLLAGPIHLFAGAAYLGAANMVETGPGGALTLPFGADNRIRVTRTQLPQEHRDAGLTGRDHRITFGYRTAVENLLGTTAKVVLEERIPVSEDARIEVEQGKSTTPGSTSVRERPGVLQWRLSLEHDDRKEIVIDYTVRYPGDIVIAGLR